MYCHMMLYFFAMNKYELLLVLPGTLDEGEAAAKTEEVLSVIREFGQEAELRALGKNRLAYPIKQVRYGYFYTTVFSADTENIKKIEEKLRLVRGLLRAIIGKYNQAVYSEENPSRLTGMVAQTDAEEETVKSETAAVNKAEEDPATEVKSEEMAETVEMAADEATDNEKTMKSEDVKEEAATSQEKPAKSKVLDLKDIDKKLDEILADDNIDI
jgi:ribosomal protein S6